jgi:hypothetical protein
MCIYWTKHFPIIVHIVTTPTSQICVSAMFYPLQKIEKCTFGLASNYGSDSININQAVQSRFEICVQTDMTIPICITFMYSMQIMQDNVFMSKHYFMGSGGKATH